MCTIWDYFAPEKGLSHSKDGLVCSFLLVSTKRSIDWLIHLQNSPSGRSVESGLQVRLPLCWASDCRWRTTGEWSELTIEEYPTSFTEGRSVSSIKKKNRKKIYTRIGVVGMWVKRILPVSWVTDSPGVDTTALGNKSSQSLQYLGLRTCFRAGSVKTGVHHTIFVLQILTYKYVDQRLMI